MAFGKLFGISFTYVKYKYEIAFKQSFGGTSFNSTSVTDLAFISFRPGTKIKVGPINMGAYYDNIKLKGKTDSSFSRSKYARHVIIDQVPIA